MKIRNKLLFTILALALIPAIAISLVFYITTRDILGEQIEKAHYEQVTAVDTLIFVVVSDLVNIAYTAAPKIADLIPERNVDAIREKLNIIDEINRPYPYGTERGLGYHIVVVTDNRGEVLARSETATIEGETVEMKVKQTGPWCLLEEEPALKIAFSNALEGKIDARKIIYSEEFIRREGYGFLIDDYGYENMMGLTVHIPIFNERDEQGEEKEQIGVIAIITILNNNHAAIGAINAITGTEFTAITPDGEIMASFFVDPPRPAEIRVDGKTLVEKAKIRAAEMRKGLKATTGKDSVFHTEERIYLRSCVKEVEGKSVKGVVVFRDGEGICYVEGVEIPKENLEKKAYRFHFIAEVDPELKYVSIRGIAYNLTEHDLLVAAQRKSFGIVFLITFLMISGLSLVIARKGTAPIIKFTKAIQKIEKEKNFGEKVNIKTGDEIEALAKSFNDMSEKISQYYQEIKEQKDILEIKVGARTRQLREISNNLEQEVKERTEELQKKVDELERHLKVVVGRELKMIELKKEIEILKKRKPRV